MRAQTVLLAAVAALACLGVTQAIRCYSCGYSNAGSGSENDPKCGDPFDSSLVSLTGPNSTESDHSGELVPDPSWLSGQARNLTAFQSQQLQELAKRFKVPESTETGVKAGPPYAVYCAKLSGTFPGGVTLTLRGFTSGDEISPNTCESREGGSFCVCDESECNSASGIQLSLALIAATSLIGKLMC